MNTPTLQPAVTEPTLLAFLRLIIEAVHPDKIFRVRHEFVDDTESQLIIVVLRNGSQGFSEAETYLEFATAGLENTGFMLLRPDFLHRKLLEGHVFYTLVCRNENLLYAADDSVLPQLPATQYRLLAEKADAEFMVHFNRALHFFEGAYFYKDDPETAGPAVFMLHQSAELCYRAFIGTFCRREPRSHEIRVLQKCAGLYAPVLGRVFPVDTEAGAALLKKLDEAYTEGRYNRTFVIDSGEMEKLFRLVDGLFLAVVEVVGLLVREVVKGIESV